MEEINTEYVDLVISTGHGVSFDEENGQYE